MTQYLELAKAVNEAGLLRRRRGFYWTLIIGGALAVAAILTGVALLGDTWWQLLLAALLGVVVAQFGFLGHEAAHKQVFDSPRWNRWVGRFLAGLGTGLSYAWWMDKHGRHHSRPNQLGTDPDIESAVVAFTPEAADRRTGLAAALARRQGWFFLPLLLFEGWELHVASVRTLTTRDGMRQRWPELALLTVRHVAYLTFLFLVLPPGLAVAFVVVQVSVFGFLLGGAFAPNHIGMPIVGRGVTFDFLRRQVLMSRNIRGGPVVHFFLGGLEYQIEHHLFPKAPRPNLPKIRRTVRDYCRRHGVSYTETSLVQAYRDLMGYLNQVGLKNRNRYTCPLVREYRA
ncbi:fatty acid desaturase family protein [Microlunatus parietis]|uniref:Fatty acid desaturase n=1 Tax=Microlunatus parietis TaxID=682979 RepID=A0A7Y9L7K4_9ACTN|nr:acyl-CoA desaturase [Microlunatus parietis]NYE69869.1 fatty acid desaturase [Microlunatus parietis]